MEVGMTKIEAVVVEYAPYNKMLAFWEGYDYYVASATNSYVRMTREYRDVEAQAFDRGMEAAMRIGRGECRS
jgi:hypothetical protein